MVTQVRKPPSTVPVHAPHHKKDGDGLAAAAIVVPTGEVDDLTIHYPSSDGEPMAETEWQYIPLTETVAALRHWFRNRPDVYVIGDMLVYYRMNRADIRVAPDVFVVFGASASRPRNSWLVWREGKAPDFVMEIASVGTWERDANAKRDTYASLGVTEYWRFDPTGECFTPELAGETLVDGEYRTLPVAEDAAGGLRGYSPLLGLEFRVEGERRLRVYDPETGERLRTLTESEDALAEASASYQIAAARRRIAESALTAEAAARQAAESAHRAAAAEREAEVAARQAAEAAHRALDDENRMLREQLRRLQAGQ